MVDDRVTRIQVPWIEDGKVNFVPTRVKWIETLSNSKRLKQSAEEEKVEANE